MTRKRSRLLGFVLLAVALGFVLLALQHPELSFPWPLAVTRLLYGLYAAATVFFLIAPFQNK